LAKPAITITGLILLRALRASLPAPRLGHMRRGSPVLPVRRSGKALPRVLRIATELVESTTPSAPCPPRAWLAGLARSLCLRISAFSFKAPQRITHFKRLLDCGELVEQFIAAPRTSSSGPASSVLLLFQLPT